MVFGRCDNPQIRLVPMGNMTGKSEGSFNVEYRPLIPTTTTTTTPGVVPTQEALLTLKLNELGIYKFKLLLRASPPTSEPSLVFEAPLGGLQTNTFV